MKVVIVFKRAYTILSTHSTRYASLYSATFVVEIIGMNQETASIDSVMKMKLNNYNLVKGSLTQMQRKQMCVLTVFHGQLR